MLRLLRLICLLAVLMSLAAPLWAQDDAIESDLATLLVTVNDDPAVALYIVTPDGEWALARGRANIDVPLPVAPDARFRIGSVSKTFVTVVALQLVEEGELTLDAPAADYLPVEIVKSLANADRATVRDLLAMTSGIPEYLEDDFWSAIFDDPSYAWTAAEVLTFAEGKAAYFEPGEGFEYTNTNYILLQLIIESVTGEPLHIAVRERILDPLGLANTYTQVQETLPGGFVRGYAYWDDNLTLDDVSEVNDGAGLGDGALVSTTVDLAAFYRALFIDESLLDSESLDVMLSDAEEDEYGLGIEVIETDLGKAIGHTGAVLGFNSAVFYLPDEEAIGVVLAARDDFDVSILEAALALVIDSE
jgi:D-alanyl-D-alanine carboxypeptidase